MTIIVVLVLRRLVVFDMKATVMKYSKVIADCVPGNLDSILLFQNLDQLSGRERMLCIGVFKEVLIQIKNILQFPAGKIEINETPADAAKRELKEETGYEFTRLEYMGYFYSAPQFSDEKFYAFFGRADKTGNKLLTAREEIEVTHFTLDKVHWLFGNNIIKDAKSIVAFDMWRNRCGKV